MANSQLWTGTATFTQGSSTSFGFYDNDYQYQLDAVKVAKYCATRLGYPSMDVEMGGDQFFTCFESAVTTYGNEVYLYQIRNNFLSLEANPNNVELNNPKSWNNMDLQKIPMKDVFKHYGIEESTIDFLGHAVALHY